MTAELDISVEVAPDGTARVSVVGEIDLSNADQLRQAMTGPAASSVVVDLSGVGYLDSAGLAVLFECGRSGRLEILAPAGGIAAALVAVTHLDEIATIHAT